VILFANREKAVTTDPKRLVASAYDRVADSYLARYGASTVRDHWLSELLKRLPSKGGARVLDLGCGAGIPVTRALVTAGHTVVGVDGSAAQISRARDNVPVVEFIHIDMTAVDFPTHSFDAVTAFYSITHVPRLEHDNLLRRVNAWLKPGGLLVASFGADALTDWRGDWLGTKMFFSHYDAETNLALLRGAGFAIERSEVMDQDDENARFLWVIARPVSDAAAQERLRFTS
jgi:cyclopropane fatty-acyl-phospholipid synthase-like methyltransferase